jgi:hypothetical protein
MDQSPARRSGQSRRHTFAAWGCHAALIAGLAACGGGNSGGPDIATAPPDPVSSEGATQPGEVPPTLLIAEPRNVDHTSDLALAWSSEGAFVGRIVAQIEFGFSFAQGPFFELQANGPAATYEGGDLQGPANFDLRYADGFFLLTAQRDNDVSVGLPFGVDIYPPDVTRVPPSSPPCTPTSTGLCSNSLGFINFNDWPKRAGESASLLIPRADPAALNYTVLVKPSSARDFGATLVNASGQSAKLPRGVARVFDFPTARAKVRGCNAAGDCVESEERSLQSALVNGVIPIVPRGSAPNAQVALDGLGRRMAYREQFGPDGPAGVLIVQRFEQGRWFSNAAIENSAAGFGRTLALSRDGNTLAVEASPCPVATIVCDAAR